MQIEWKVEGNAEEVPIFSPGDEFVKAREGVLFDYQWVDIGFVKSPLEITSTMDLDGTTELQ